MKSEPLDLTEPFDRKMFETVLSTANAMGDEIHQAAGRIIKKARVKQKRDFDCRHLSASTVNVGDKVLLNITGEMIGRVVNLPIARAICRQKISKNGSISID